MADVDPGPLASSVLSAIDTPGPFIALGRTLLESGIAAPLAPLAEAMITRWPKNERVRAFLADVTEEAARPAARGDMRGLAKLRKLLVEARKADDLPRLLFLSDIAVRGFPGDGWALENSLRVLNGAGAFEAALQAFDRAPPPVRATSEAMFLAYGAAYKSGDPRRAALRALALEMIAASGQADLWTGRLLRMENNAEGALAAFVRAVEAAPGDGVAAREVANLGLALGRIGAVASYALQAEASASPDLRTAIGGARDLLIAAGGSLESAAAGEAPWSSATTPAEAFAQVCGDPDITPYPPASALMMVGGSLAAGGAERILSTLFAAYRRALGGDAVRLVLFECAADAPSAFYLPQTGIPLSEILIGRTAHVPDRKIAWLPKPMAIRVQAIHDHIVAARPAVIHATLDMANVCAAYAAILAGVPRIVLHVHNMRPSELAVEGAYNHDFDHCYRALLKRPDVHLVAVSGATLDDYLDWIGAERTARTHAIHNGFDFTEFDNGSAHDAAASLRETLGVAPDAPLIGTAFRFAELKRPDWWVEIAARVAARHPDAHFILFGDGELLEETRALAIRLGLEDRIHFPGRVTNLNEVIGALDLFMLTSRTEGLPNVLIEAQAAGVPVVSFDVGGARDTFSDGVTGRLVAEQSIEAMTAAVSDLLRRRDDLTAMGAAARAYVRDRFPVERMVDDLAAVLGITK